MRKHKYAISKSVQYANTCIRDKQVNANPESKSRLGELSVIVFI